MTSVSSRASSFASTQIRPESAMPSAAKRRAGRKTLIAIFLVCLAPVLASYAAFYGWRPQGTRAYGKLVQPPIAVSWPSEASHIAPPQGKWVLSYAAPSSCDQSCQTHLYQTRQVRTALGSEMERVVRIWLVTDGGKPDANLLAQHPGLIVLHAANAYAHAAEVVAKPGYIMLVDPTQHLMMRFPADPDPKAMLKDLQRLLKYSPAGSRA